MGRRTAGVWSVQRASTVTPRNPLESGSKVKMSIGSSGTTKASLKEGAPMETPDATPMKWADTVGLVSFYLDIGWHCQHRATRLLGTPLTR